MKHRMFINRLILGILIAILSSLMPCSCVFEAPADGVMFSEGLITCYDIMDSVGLAYYPHDRLLVAHSEYTPDNRRADLYDYEYYQAKYDDTHFNRNQVPGQNPVVLNEFQSIDVFSNNDFNDISAGESLAGKILIFATSPYKWLMSKGKLTFDWKLFRKENPLYYWCSGREFYFPIVGPLKDVNYDDMYLIWPAISFKFIEDPIIIKEHRLTVVIRDTEREMVSSIDVVFE